MRSSRVLLFVFVVALSSPFLLPAQQLTGSVQGTVKDSTGGLVVGATVELVSSTTGIRQSRQTDVGGEFLFPAVKPGAYTLSASQSGFKTGSQRLDVELNKASRIDFVLLVGEITERVEV